MAGTHKKKRLYDTLVLQHGSCASATTMSRGEVFELSQLLQDQVPTGKTSFDNGDLDDDDFTRASEIVLMFAENS